MKKKNLTKEEKIELLKDSMAGIMINTLNSKTSLFDLCEKVGIKNRVVYWNNIEKPVKKSERTINNRFVIKKVIHDYGFIFNDDFQVRHVLKKHFNLYDNDIIEIRERV